MTTSRNQFGRSEIQPLCARVGQAHPILDKSFFSHLYVEFPTNLLAYVVAITISAPYMKFHILKPVSEKGLNTNKLMNKETKYLF